MYISYHTPIICCVARLTAVMAIQQQAPNARAEPPDFINFTILVLSPIATMAIVIKYLEMNVHIRVGQYCCNKRTNHKV